MFFLVLFDYSDELHCCRYVYLMVLREALLSKSPSLFVICNVFMASLDTRLDRVHTATCTKLEIL